LLRPGGLLQLSGPTPYSRTASLSTRQRRANTAAALRNSSSKNASEVLGRQQSAARSGQGLEQQWKLVRSLDPLQLDTPPLPNLQLLLQAAGSDKKALEQNKLDDLQVLEIMAESACVCVFVNASR